VPDPKRGNTKFVERVRCFLSSIPPHRATFNHFPPPHSIPTIFYQAPTVLPFSPHAAVGIVCCLLPSQETFLDLCVKEYLKARAKTSTLLGQLFLAGDVDGDGELTLDEFSTIIQHIDNTISARETSTMYREAHHGSDVMKKEVFVQVCLNHGLMSYKSQQKRFTIPPATVRPCMCVVCVWGGLQ